MIWTGSWPLGERAVINASPLIFLARGGHLGLLRVFAYEVWVPEAVAGEQPRQQGFDFGQEDSRWTESRSCPF